MALTPKLLGQAREASTNAVSVYAVPSGLRAIIRSIVIANTSGATATVRVFVDEDGSTYNESTAIIWDLEIPADSVYNRDCFLPMDNTDTQNGGNVAYRSSVSSALTITIGGVEINE